MEKSASRSFSSPRHNLGVTLCDCRSFLIPTRLKTNKPKLHFSISASHVFVFFSLPLSCLTWVGICARRMLCSVSMETPGGVVAKNGLWLSVAGLGIPGWLAPVFTSDPFPKARMAFSRGGAETSLSTDHNMAVDIFTSALTSSFPANPRTPPPCMHDTL